jgi:spore maturation protein CgeB
MMNKWRVILLDTKKENPNHYLVLCLLDALKQSPYVEFVIKGEYKNAINLALENECNLFFAFDGEQLDKAYCERLKHVCRTSIVWNVEDPYEINVNKLNIDLFDLVFTNDKGCVSAYGEKGRHLPLASSKSMHFHQVKVPGDQYNYDLFFAGTAWPNRISLLKSIENDLKDIKMKLALPTNIHLPKISLNLPVSSYNWRTPNSEFARFSNVSRVTLSLHRQFTASGGDAEAMTPGPRLFEVAMAGGFQLIDNNIPGVEDYLDEGIDYIGFSSPKECIDKLKYYLEHKDERVKIAKNAQMKVLEKHTYQNRLEYIFKELVRINKKPQINKEIRENKNILVVTHNTINHIPYGGVEIYQDIVNNELRDKFNIYYLVPCNQKKEGKEYIILNSKYIEVDRMINHQPFPAQSQYLLTNSEVEKKYANILLKHNIGLVHYQHFIKNIPSLPFISKALGIKNIYSIHDFYSITHKFNLINVHGKYDANILKNSKNMDIFLAEHEGINLGSQDKRKAFWSNMLDQMDIIHANSITTKDIILNYYPNVEERKIIVEGIPFDGSFNFTNEINKIPNKNALLEVLILGNFTHIKGANDIIDIIGMCKSNNIRFHVYGQIAPEYKDKIKNITSEKVIFYGEYNTKDLNIILSDKHVSLHLSQWPETYCITLSEVWKAGIIPIVYDIGALGERVTRSTGYKVSLGDTGSIVDILEFLSISKEPLKLIRGNIEDNEPYEISEKHSCWLSDVYNNHTRSIGNSNYHCDLDLNACGVKVVNEIWADMGNKGFLRGLNIYYSIPRNPYRLMNFLVLQIRAHGFKVTLNKIIIKVKNRLGY